MRSPRDNLVRRFRICRFLFVLCLLFRRAVPVPFPDANISSINPMQLFILCSPTTDRCATLLFNFQTQILRQPLAHWGAEGGVLPQPPAEVFGGSQEIRSPSIGNVCGFCRQLCQRATYAPERGFSNRRVSM